MIGTTLSHYRILEKLGAGGMGVVYRARDERLERDVALKLLPDGALADPDSQRRFRREALALSRLNHPSIATIHDFDNQDGTDFLVMEYVEGDTLAHRLAAGPLAEKELIALGVQIADALEAAHEHGVIHRDLKPGNIVVTPRARVKVLDFGLAQMLETPDEAAVTQARTRADVVVGTLPYMAPEQLLGGALDGRTDLYALGAVLYEMATGQTPFTSALPTALVHEITSTPAPSPRRLRQDLSPQLDRVILKALEKSPALRYQSAHDLTLDLNRLTAPTTPPAGGGHARDVPRIGSLAVLPLVNLSGDPEQEFFADGMTDALIADLAQIAALRVISRTSVMRYKGSSKPLAEIARELGVDAVVEGTVTRAGDKVRISAQLIDAASDRHLWARSYQREFCDILELQGEVANEIAREIRVQVTPSEHARLTTGRNVDPRAFEAYLKGRHFWNKRTEPDVRAAVEHFNHAIEIDPTYAVAYAGLADSYNVLGDLDAIRPSAAAAGAKAAAHRSLELDPWLAESHTSLGFLHFFYEWDWEQAEAAFREALRLNAGYATGHQWFSEYLVSQGRFEEAIAEARRALEIDPLAPVIGATLSDVLYFSRRYDEAIDQLDRNLEMHPQFIQAWNDLGRVTAQHGQFERAFDAFERSARLRDLEPDMVPGLGQAYALAGRAVDAHRVLARLNEVRSHRHVSPHAIAVIHIALGERDEGLEWLERAYHQQDRALVWLRIHPRLDPVRDEPRFQALLGKMRL